jgi:hypothetical protein
MDVHMDSHSPEGNLNLARNGSLNVFAVACGVEGMKATRALSGDWAVCVVVAVSPMLGGR